MLPQRRQAVVDSAHQLFARHGYKKTSLSDIARGAGVSKSAVYLVASSKIELYFQVLHAAVWGCVNEAIQEIDVSRPAPDQLAEHAGEQLQWMLDQPLVRALLVERVESFEPEWAVRFQELRRLGRSPMARLVELGQRQQLFDEQLDAEAVAHTIQDLQVSLVLLDEGTVGPEHPRWQSAISLLCRGMSY